MNINDFEDCQVLETIDNQFILINTKDKYIGNNIYFKKQWEPHVRFIFNLLINEGMTVIDIGANIGAHTIYLSKLVGNTGKVIAFEPDKMHYNSLMFSLILNKCYNTTIHNIGIGENEDNMYIDKCWKDRKTENKFGAINLKKTVDDPDDQCVIVKSIDSFCFPSINLIKIDAEGMEDSVMKGMTDTIKKYKPYIVIEIHEKDITRLAKIFRDLNYKMLNIDGMIDFLAYPIENEKVVLDIFSNNIK